MTNHKQKTLGAGVSLVLALLVVYFSWAAFSSSMCAAEGIANQSRTTWSPVTGCVIDRSDTAPWNN